MQEVLVLCVAALRNRYSVATVMGWSSAIGAIILLAIIKWVRGRIRAAGK